MTALSALFFLTAALFNAMCAAAHPWCPINIACGLVAAASIIALVYTIKGSL